MTNTKIQPVKRASITTSLIYTTNYSNIEKPTERYKL